MHRSRPRPASRITTNPARRHPSRRRCSTRHGPVGDVRSSSRGTPSGTSAATPRMNCQLTAEARHDDDAEHDEAATTKSGPAAERRSAPVGGGGRRRAVEVAAADEREPQRHPQQPGHADRPEHDLPPAAERPHEQDVQRDRGSRRATAPLWRMPLPSGRSFAVRICRAVMSAHGQCPASKSPSTVRHKSSQRNVPAPGSSPGSSTSGDLRVAGEARWRSRRATSRPARPGRGVAGRSGRRGSRTRSTRPRRRSRSSLRPSRTAVVEAVAPLQLGRGLRRAPAGPCS